jgi:nucleotidyltransferase substrate binding protein (TIGR01987 family)
MSDTDTYTDANADIRWKQRFANYKKAHDQFKKTAVFFDEKSGCGIEGDVAMEALIKCFELTYELAWQTMKDYISYKGHVEALHGSRDSIRAALEFDLIKNGQLWIDMIGDRNRAAHTYDEHNAASVARKIADFYRGEFAAFEEKMDSLL